MPLSPASSSHSSTKRKEALKKKKKSWSLEGKNKKGQPKSRQQIKAMLLAKEKIKEEDLDAPPNSDAKNDSLRIDEQQQFMPEKEEYVMKQPQIALKRKVKKKGNRRANSVRDVHRNRSDSDSRTPKDGSRQSPVDTSLFKDRSRDPSANNSPDHSDRQRGREARRRPSEARTQEDRSIVDKSSGRQQDSERDSMHLPLAREPEPEIATRRSAVVQRSTMDKSASRMAKTKQDRYLVTAQQKEPMTVRPSQPRTTRSTMGLPTTAAPKSTGETSTQLALEPEPDLERVRRVKEAAFMKRFIRALGLMPNSAPTRNAPAPRHEESPSDSSKSQGGYFKHNMHYNMRKHPK